MAEVIKTNIDVAINTSQAASELRKLQQQINAFNLTLNKGSIDQLDASKRWASGLSDVVNDSKFFRAEMVRMQTSAGALDAVLKRGSSTLGQFFSAAFNKRGAMAAETMSLASERVRTLQTQFIATSKASHGMQDALAIRPLAAFSSQAAVAEERMRILSNMFRQGTTQIVNFGKNIQWAGRQLMVGFTVPLTIFGGIATKVFRELEKEAVNFKKVYGDIFTLDSEVEANLDAVKELAKEFTKYGIAAKNTLELAALAAQSGKQGAELQQATIQATRLSILGDIERQDAMKATIAMQSAFKMSNDELANSINFLNMVENSSVVSLQNLVEAIPRVAPVIVGLGGDIKDMAVFLAAMQEGGVNAAEAANGLKSSLGRLIAPSKQAKDMANDFGISLEKIVNINEGNVLGMVTTLSDAMKKLTDLQKQQLLSAVFGKFQFARMGALFENITREGSQASQIIGMMDMSISDMASTADKELGAIEDSIGTKLTASIERLKLAIAPIGELFARIAIPLIGLITKAAEWFNSLSDNRKTVIAYTAAIFGGLIPALTMLTGLFFNLVGQVGKLGQSISIFGITLFKKGPIAAIKTLTQSTKYLSLAEIDAANAARQLGSATEIANAALLKQVGAVTPAITAINSLTNSYRLLAQEQLRATTVQPSLFFAGRGIAAGRMLPIVKRNKGGEIFTANRGNTVPGVGNTDTVPAMLTPGEFVVNKESTKKNMNLLRAINDGQNMNVGGKVKNGMLHAMAGTLVRAFGAKRTSSFIPATSGPFAGTTTSQMVRNVPRKPAATTGRVVGEKNNYVYGFQPNTNQQLNGTSIIKKGNFDKFGVPANQIKAEMTSKEGMWFIDSYAMGPWKSKEYKNALAAKIDAIVRGNPGKEIRFLDKNGIRRVLNNDAVKNDPNYKNVKFISTKRLHDEKLLSLLEPGHLSRLKMVETQTQMLARGRSREYTAGTKFFSSEEELASLTNFPKGTVVRVGNQSTGASLYEYTGKGWKFNRPITPKETDVAIGNTSYASWSKGKKNWRGEERPKGIHASHIQLNKGGQVPGVQYLFGGGLLRKFLHSTRGGFPSGASRKREQELLFDYSKLLGIKERGPGINTSAPMSRPNKKGEMLFEDKFSIVRGHQVSGVPLSGNDYYAPGIMFLQGRNMNSALNKNKGVSKKELLEDFLNIEKRGLHPASLMLSGLQNQGFKITPELVANVKKSYDAVKNNLATNPRQKVNNAQYLEEMEKVIKNNLDKNLYDSLFSVGTKRTSSGGSIETGRMINGKYTKANKGGMIPGVQGFMAGGLARGFQKGSFSTSSASAKTLVPRAVREHMASKYPQMSPQVKEFFEKYITDKRSSPVTMYTKSSDFITDIDGVMRDIARYGERSTLQRLNERMNFNKGGQVPGVQYLFGGGIAARAKAMYDSFLGMRQLRKSVHGGPSGITSFHGLDKRQVQGPGTYLTKDKFVASMYAHRSIPNRGAGESASLYSFTSKGLPNVLNLNRRISKSQKEDLISIIQGSNADDAYKNAIIQAISKSKTLDEARFIARSLPFKSNNADDFDFAYKQLRDKVNTTVGINDLKKDLVIGLESSKTMNKSRIRKFVKEIKTMQNSGKYPYSDPSGINSPDNLNQLVIKNMKKFNIKETPINFQQIPGANAKLQNIFNLDSGGIHTQLRHSAQDPQLLRSLMASIFKPSQFDSKQRSYLTDLIFGSSGRINLRDNQNPVVRALYDRISGVKRQKVNNFTESGTPLGLNKGGQVPGVQYLFGGGIAAKRLLDTPSRRSREVLRSLLKDSDELAKLQGDKTIFANVTKSKQNFLSTSLGQADHVVGQAYRIKSKPVYDDLINKKIIDSNQFKTFDDFMKFLDKASIDSLGSIPKNNPIVSAFNESYLKINHGIGTDDTLRFYRNARSKSRAKDPAVGYYSLDREMGWGYGLASDLIDGTAKRYHVDLRPREIPGPILSGGYADEFAINIGDDLAAKAKEIGDMLPNVSKQLTGQQGMTRFFNDKKFYKPDETFKFNKGNIVPGVGNTDTVPAMLTPGEFVINKKSTQENYDLLTAINNGSLSGYNKGGKVKNGVLYAQEGVKVPKIRGAGPIGMAAGLAASLPFFSEGAQENLGPMGSMVASMVSFMAVQSVATKALNKLGTSLKSAGGTTTVFSKASQNISTSFLQLSKTVKMIGPKLIPFVGTAITVAQVFTAFGKTMDKIRQSGEILNNAMYGSSETLKNMAKSMGRMTPSEQLARQRAELVSGARVSQEDVEFSSKFMETEESKKLIKDLETVRKMGGDQTQALKNQLGQAVLAGIFTPEEAKQIALDIGLALKNQKLSIDAVAQLSDLFGPDGKKLKNNRLEILTEISAPEDIKTIVRQSEKELERIQKAHFRFWEKGTGYDSTLAFQKFFMAFEPDKEGLILAMQMNTLQNNVLENLQKEKEIRSQIQLELENGVISLGKYNSEISKLNRRTSVESIQNAIKATGISEEELSKLKFNAPAGAIGDGILGSGSNIFKQIGGKVLGYGGVESNRTAGIFISEEAKQVENLIEKLKDAVKIDLTESGFDEDEITMILRNVSESFGKDLQSQAELFGQILRGEINASVFGTVDLLKENDPAFKKGLESMARSQGFLKQETVITPGRPVGTRGFIDAKTETKPIMDQSSELGAQKLTPFANAPGLFSQAITAISANQAGGSAEGQFERESADSYIQRLTSAFQTMQSVSKDLVFALELDLNSPIDIFKYDSKDIEGFERNWNVLDALNPGIDKTLVFNLIGRDSDGNSRPTPDVIKDMNLLHKALQDLNSEDKDVVAKAELELNTMLNNNTDLSPEEITKRLNELRESYQDVWDKVPAGTKLIIVGLQATINGLDPIADKDKIEEIKKSIQGYMDLAAVESVDTETSGGAAKESAFQKIMKSTKATKDYMKAAANLVKNGLKPENIALINQADLLEMTVTERKKAIKAVKEQMNIQKALDYLMKSSSERKIIDLEKEVVLIDRNIDLVKRQIEDVEKLNKVEQDRIDSLSRQNEIDQRQTSIRQRALDLLSRKEEEINKVYDARNEALDKVVKVNDRVARQQKSQISLASALASGDFATAASVAGEMQSDFAKDQIEDTKAALELQRQKELESLTVSVNGQLLTRTQIEAQILEINDRIYERNLEIERLEDIIYNRKETLIKPLEEQINLITADRERIIRQIEDLQFANWKKEMDRIDKLIAKQRVLNSLKGIKNPKRKNLGGVIERPLGGLIPYMGGGKVLERPLGGLIPYMGGGKVLERPLGGLIPYMGGGRVKKYAMGGFVGFRGSREAPPPIKMNLGSMVTGSVAPGLGNLDRVPALLTPGEFVVRKSVAKENMPFLRALNKDVFPQFNSGMDAGSITPEVVTSVIGGTSLYNNTYSINVNVPNTNADPEQIASAVMSKIKRYSNNEIRSTRR